MAEPSGGRSELPEPSRGSPLARGSDRIREATKWIIASFSAVGAALVAGTQVSSIGELDWGTPRMHLALLAGVCVVCGITLAIWKASDVLVAGPIALDELTSENISKPMEDLLRRNRVFYGGFGSIDALQAAYLRATARMALVYTDLSEAKPPITTDMQARAEQVDGHAQFVGQLVSRVLEFASMTQVQDRFRRSRPWLFVGAVLTTAGVGVFTWAVNPSRTSKDAPAIVRITQLRTADVVLSEEGARILASRLGEKCDTRRVRSLIPLADKGGPVPVVSVPTADCQPVQFGMTQAIGVILPDR